MADDAGTGLVKSLAKTMTGGTIVDSIKGAYKRITGAPDDDGEKVDPDKQKMIDDMNQQKAADRAKRVQDAFAAQKIPTQTVAQKRPVVKAKMTVVSKPAMARKK